MSKMNLTRRKLIKILSATTAATLFDLSATFAQAHKPFFTQNPLPYSFNALEPYLDAPTMDIHYSKHAASYCSNLNSAIQKTDLEYPKDLSDILKNISAYPESIRNNGGGHYNHELFWLCMKPGGNQLKENLLKQNILNAFGSIDLFKSNFEEAAKNRFGSGWVWLYADEKKTLKIASTPNQDNPLMNISPVRGFPILCLDVWEHAYYLHYQNRRADYVRQWWNVIDWDFIADRYAKYYDQ